MPQRPTVDDFVAYMGLTLAVDDPKRAVLNEGWEAAQEMIEDRIRDGVLPTDPTSDEYPARVRTGTLLQANRLYKRKGSPEGVAGFGDLGVIRISGIDPDVEQLLGTLLKMDGFG